MIIITLDKQISKCFEVLLLSTNRKCKNKTFVCVWLKHFNISMGSYSLHVEFWIYKTEWPFFVQIRDLHVKHLKLLVQYKVYVVFFFFKSKPAYTYFLQIKSLIFFKLKPAYTYFLQCSLKIFSWYLKHVWSLSVSPRGSEDVCKSILCVRILLNG